MMLLHVESNRNSHTLITLIQLLIKLYVTSLCQIYVIFSYDKTDKYLF